MPNENPGAYSEARDRIREKNDREHTIVESKKEDFEKTKTLLRKKKTLDVGELKRRIETGHSLDSLKSEIRIAYSDGTISQDTYDRVIASIERWEHKWAIEIGTIDPNKLPFSQNKLAQYLENQPLGVNIWSDMIWFLYGFCVQGSAILVIIAWKILMDFLFIPRDIYREFFSHSTKS